MSTIRGHKSAASGDQTNGKDDYWLALED